MVDSSVKRRRPGAARAVHARRRISHVVANVVSVSHLAFYACILSLNLPVLAVLPQRQQQLPSESNTFSAADEDAVAAFTPRHDGSYTLQPDAAWPNCPSPKYDMNKPGVKPDKWRKKSLSGNIRTGGRGHLKDMVALAKKCAVNNTVVLTLADYRYTPTLMNWLHSMAAVGVTNIVVLGLDQSIQSQLLEMGVPSFFSQAFIDHAHDLFGVEAQREFVRDKVKERNKGNQMKRIRLGALWCMRMLVIRTLLEAGLSVVQSDADAVPLQNPFPLLARAPGDVVAQRGTFPRRVRTDWTGIAWSESGNGEDNKNLSTVHSTLCFGFIMWRSTPATLALIDLSWSSLIYQYDDQKGVQYAIIGCFDFTWGNDGPLPNNRNGAAAAARTKYQDVELARREATRTAIETGISTKPIIGNVRLKVSLLPTPLVPRHCGEEHGSPESKPDVVLTHCYAKKKGNAKQNTARKHGLAFLGRGWKDMKRFNDESTAGFLQRLGAHPKAFGETNGFPCEALKWSLAAGNTQETARILNATAADEKVIAAGNVAAEVAKRCTVKG